MKVLLVGDGAREHILAEQLARSCELSVAMEHRNPGIENFSQKFFICDFSNIEAIGGWAIREKIDLALVTSEAAQAKGLADALSDAGITPVSPLGSASAVGENTTYAANLMVEAGIARPAFAVCKTQADVRKAMAAMPHLVMKPAVRVDWKGTRVGDMDFRKKTDIMKEAKLLIKRHGSVLLEEWVEGESFSVQALSDGKSVALMPPVHAERRALEKSVGRLTGGMGSYSSGRLLPFMRQSDMDYARNCMEKLIRILRAKGVDYRGPICGRFMVAKQGTVMVDVYATFGGMETLNNLMLLRTQLVEVLTSIADGSLAPASFLEKATMVKYVVPEGYPDKPKKSRISIDERALWNNGAKAYFDSVDMKPKGIFTTKGRTLAICASGNSLEEAEAKAEAAASSIGGKVWHRKDIGSRDYVGREVKHVGLLRSGA